MSPCTPQGNRYNASMTLPLLDALQELRSNPRFADRITAWRHLPARPACYAPIPSDLQPRVVSALRLPPSCVAKT